MFHDRRIELKSLTQIGYLRQAAMIVDQIHQAIYQAARPGVTPQQLDQISAQVIAKHGAKSNFLGYYDYPATTCISVNDTVVHGIPNGEPLQAGDLVSFDCGCYLEREAKQWHGDSCFSIVVSQDAPSLPAPSIAAGDLGMIDQNSSKAQQLNWLTRQATWAGVAALETGKTVACVGEAVEAVVAEGKDRFGWEADIVQEFTGHGIGTQMHQPPDVINYATRGKQAKLRPGMVLCIEPILTAGSAKVTTLPDQWTVKTKDHQLACHWECQVALLEDGICVLNQADFGAAGLAQFGVKPVSL